MVSPVDRLAVEVTRGVVEVAGVQSSRAMRGEHEASVAIRCDSVTDGTEGAMDATTEAAAAAAAAEVAT
jgi:hypothetical protein